jgi:CMP-N-acetylneuraminic acid synthetase
MEYYRPNGAIYVFRKSFFMHTSGYYGPKSYGYVMPPERSIDIDTPLDFVVAEAIFKYLLVNRGKVV